MPRKLRYRPVACEEGSCTYARWVQKLQGKHGVYVLRSKRTGQVLYVGESHTKRLYGTLTRHFQAWEGFTAGTTYSLWNIEAAVIVTKTKAAAVKLQIALIKKLAPRDNSHHVDDGADFDPADLGEDFDGNTTGDPVPF